MRKAQVKLKPGILELLMKENDTNEIGLAHMFGLSLTQIYRTKTSKSKVGADFIAGALRATNKQFEDIFDVQ